MVVADALETRAIRGFASGQRVRENYYAPVPECVDVAPLVAGGLK
jgi:hypothetical protein